MSKIINYMTVPKLWEIYSEQIQFSADLRMGNTKGQQKFEFIINHYY